MEVRLATGDGRSGGETYPTVYYPGTIDARQAAIVAVEPGTELQGIDVQLIRARGVEVWGRVTGLAGRRSTPFLQWSSWSRSGNEVNLSLGSCATPWFATRKGSSSISAMADGFDGENKLTARQTLEVGESDIDGIQLNMGRPWKLSGRIISRGTQGVAGFDDRVGVGGNRQIHRAAGWPRSVLPEVLANNRD